MSKLQVNIGFIVYDADNHVAYAGKGTRENGTLVSDSESNTLRKGTNAGAPFRIKYQDGVERYVKDSEVTYHGPMMGNSYVRIKLWESKRNPKHEMRG